MLKLRKLYSEPKIFNPITFDDGINLILGTTTEDNIKTNGVGKSMAIEFINYGLLKKSNESRVILIPNEAFPHHVFICLDFEIGNNKITSKRSIKDNQCPILIVNGQQTKYANLDDALEFLTTLLFGTSNDDSIPSFRSMMGPLIRDERSEFKSIIQCYDTARYIAPDYTPHLYLLNIDPKPYNEAKKLSADIERLTKIISKLKEDVKAITGKNISEAKADLNELTNQVKRIQDDINYLENNAGYEILAQEIIDLENQIEQERSREAVLKSEISKIKLFKGDNYIDDKEVGELYNQFKSGLGDIIKKGLQEVILFKKKIDNFQRTLIDNRKNALIDEINIISEKISSLEKQHKVKLSILDQKGFLKNLKKAIATHQHKLEEQAALSSLIKKYNDYENDKKDKQNQRNILIHTLDGCVRNMQSIIDSVEQTILDIHEYVAGNRHSSFKIDVKKSKEIFKFDLRIYDDGSHSNEREKVFLYDISLLINSHTSKRHPGLLIHDNIFHVDKDTLIKSLNCLYDNLSLFTNKQYILTINSDEFNESDMQSALKLDLNNFKIASFTKENRFLKINYQQLPTNK